MTTNAQVLVLNRSWTPIGICDVQRAFGLLVSDAARALDAEFRMFDFESWAALAADVSKGDDVIRTARQALRIPRVLVLQAYDRMPRQHVRFSRNAVYARDSFRCQYCGVQYPRSALNLDHVVPRSRGGKTEWSNVVCSCIQCNTKKGNKLLSEAGLTLLKQPRRPTVADTGMRPRKAYPEWEHFFTDFASASYWLTELEE